ncbi:MAG: hypothetical protein ABS79_03500 [Planctomycetes bacterium SCN 63-9]|nr:MAG: hypothetical protein ABS79_03500 [Planctomycetes bacterium SCN 63-9]
MSESSGADIPPAPISVGIGIISRNGLYLVRQRPKGTVYEGYWEFPGGKCEPEETSESAMIRECFEEIGMEVIPIRLRKVIEHTYPHGAVRLHFFDGEPALPDAQPAPGTGFRWLPLADLASLRFPEANSIILEELLAEANSR